MASYGCDHLVTEKRQEGKPHRVVASAWLGLLTRRERWGLSHRAWVLSIVATAGVFWLGVESIYPFLAVSAPVGGDILVMEGWVHDFAIIRAVDELKLRDGAEIFTTGGPVRGNGIYTDFYATIAHVGAGGLRAQGVSPDAIHAVAAREVGRDRTYVSALALRNWLREQGRTVRSVDVVTEGVHARRTRMLFQEAFGDQVRVGVIAARDPDYDSRYWWRYSEGVRDVLGETIAYVYAKCFFWPSPPRGA